jgi:large subunit ribosomal protein L25
MQRIPLKATERTVTGKKVRFLRRDGFVPGNVFGNKVDSEAVSIKKADFLKAYDEAGETGLIDLRIGEEKVRPVLIRQVQEDPVTDTILHVDFYQVKGNRASAD